MAVTRNANETNAPWPPIAHRLVFFKIADAGGERGIFLVFIFLKALGYCAA